MNSIVQSIAFSLEQAMNQFDVWQNLRAGLIQQMKAHLRDSIRKLPANELQEVEERLRLENAKARAASSAGKLRPTATFSSTDQHGTFPEDGGRAPMKHALIFAAVGAAAVIASAVLNKLRKADESSD